MFYIVLLLVTSSEVVLDLNCSCIRLDSNSILNSEPFCDWMSDYLLLPRFVPKLRMERGRWRFGDVAWLIFPLFYFLGVPWTGRHAPNPNPGNSELLGMFHFSPDQRAF